MPHLTLEYTSNLTAGAVQRELFRRLHHILADVAGIDIGNCKSRAVERDTFLVGDDAGQSGYVHLDVRILEGRAEGVKAELGQRMLETLRDAYDANDQPIQVTIELRDMAHADYFKL